MESSALGSRWHQWPADSVQWFQTTSPSGSPPLRTRLLSSDRRTNARRLERRPSLAAAKSTQAPILKNILTPAPWPLPAGERQAHPRSRARNEMGGELTAASWWATRGEAAETDTLPLSLSQPCSHTHAGSSHAVGGAEKRATQETDVAFDGLLHKSPRLPPFPSPSPQIARVPGARRREVATDSGQVHVRSDGGGCSGGRRR